MIKPEDIQAVATEQHEMHNQIKTWLTLTKLKFVSKIRTEKAKWDVIGEETQKAKAELWHYVYGDLHRDVQKILNDFERMTVLSDITPVAHNLIESKFHDLLKKLQNPFTAAFPPQGE